MRSDYQLSGRELDIAVAERVMGLVPCTSDQHNEGAEFYMPRPCHALPDSPDKGGETLSYSTSIEAAMQVVEKMRERGSQVVMRSWEGAVPWSVKFISYTSRNETEEDGDSLPEAICRTALAAIGANN